MTESSVVCSIYGESEIFTEDRFVPIQVARSSVETGECFGGAQPLMIAAGGSQPPCHSVLSCDNVCVRDRHS